MTAETERLREFWRFVVERHEIFIRRHIQKLPPPWTDDPILQRGRFTNIYRELDRVSRWLAMYLLPSGSGPTTYRRDHGPSDLAFNILVYRRFCVPETFVAIGGCQAVAKWDWDRASMALAIRAHDREPIFTGAFMLTNAGARIPKHVLVVAHLRETARQWPELWPIVAGAPLLADAHEALVDLPGMGGFLAYELLIDLCQDGLLPHSLDSWVYVGPGARRGAEALAGRALPREAAGDYIETLRRGQNEAMLDAGVRLRGPRLTLENIEQALCEYQKYLRLKAAGRIKRLFRKPKSEPWLWQDIPARFLEAAR